MIYINIIAFVYKSVYDENHQLSVIFLVIFTIYFMYLIAFLSTSFKTYGNFTRIFFGTVKRVLMSLALCYNACES